MGQTVQIVWGFNNTEWTALTALATIALAILTFLLAAVAGWQIISARREARNSRTLAACERYDVDPILDQCCRRLSKAMDNGNLAAHPQTYRLDLWTILNYLESLAIGMEYGFFNKKIVRAHMSEIFRGCIADYLTSGHASNSVKPGGHALAPDDYDLIRKYSERWERCRNRKSRRRAFFAKLRSVWPSPAKTGGSA